MEVNIDAQCHIKSKLVPRYFISCLKSFNKMVVKVFVLMFLVGALYAAPPQKPVPAVGADAHLTQSGKPTPVSSAKPTLSRETPVGQLATNQKHRREAAATGDLPPVPPKHDDKDHHQHRREAQSTDDLPPKNNPKDDKHDEHKHRRAAPESHVQQGPQTTGIKPEPAHAQLTKDIPKTPLVQSKDSPKSL